LSEAGAFTGERGDDGVLVLTIDVPGEKVNTLGKGMIAGFEELLAEVEDDASVGAVVVRSGKPDSFIAGADIKDFTRIRSAEEGEALSRAAHAVFDRIERSRLPFVAAIHGSCLGGGSPSPAATASPPTTRRRRSACPRSCSACCPVAGAPSACRGWWAWPRRSTSSSPAAR